MGWRRVRGERIHAAGYTLALGHVRAIVSPSSTATHHAGRTRGGIWRSWQRAHAAAVTALLNSPVWEHRPGVEPNRSRLASLQPSPFTQLSCSQSQSQAPHSNQGDAIVRAALTRCAEVARVKHELCLRRPAEEEYYRAGAVVGVQQHYLKIAEPPAKIAQ